MDVIHVNVDDNTKGDGEYSDEDDMTEESDSEGLVTDNIQTISEISGGKKTKNTTSGIGDV
jgi:hypothetical protein